jgi:hypothetical protein
MLPRLVSIERKVPLSYSIPVDVRKVSRNVLSVRVYNFSDLQNMKRSKVKSYRRLCRTME